MKLFETNNKSKSIFTEAEPADNKIASELEEFEAGIELANYKFNGGVRLSGYDLTSAGSLMGTLTSLYNTVESIAQLDDEDETYRPRAVMLEDQLYHNFEKEAEDLRKIIDRLNLGLEKAISVAKNLHKFATEEL